MANKKNIIVSPRILANVETTSDHRQDLLTAIQKVREMTPEDLKKMVLDSLGQDATNYPQDFAEWNY